MRQSDLKTWQRCPLQVKFQKVDGIPREQNGSASFGSVLHACILMMEVAYDLQVGLKAFERYWTDPEALEPGLTPTEYVKGTSWKKFYEEGPRIIERWWEIIQWEGDDVIAREHTFSVPIGNHILDGTVDKLAIRYLAPTDEYVLLVSDYKSNKKEPTYGYLFHDLQFSAYCLDPETPVLMADLTWKPIGEVEVGEHVLSADEYPVDTGAAKRRHWRSAEVQNAWTVEKESYRIVLSDGREITAGGTHRFLAQKSGGWEWRTVEDMQRVLHDSRRKQTGIRIASVIERPDVEVDYQGQDYCAGYLAGATLGDGAIRSDKDTQPFWQIGVGSQDQAFLDRVRACAVSFSIKLHPWQREPDGRGWQRRPMVGLQTRSRPDVEALAAMSEGLSLDWKAGWLAGLYDADGGLARSSLTYYQKDVEVLKQVQRFAQELGFTFSISTRTARLEGDRSQVAAFCGLIRPALERKVELLRDSTMRVFDDVRIVAIEALGPRTLVDITTSTGTFIADGVVSHNCYATTQKSFWTGIQNGEAIWEELKDARRIAEWVQLTGPRRKDAGERNEMHYARLRYAVNAFADSVSMGIFVPNISGETCLYCDFRKSCGLFSKEDEERLMLI